MKFAKSRICGAILLILAAAVLVTGIFAGQAANEGTPLNPLYVASAAEHTALESAQKTLTEAQEKLERAGKRTNDALKDSNACIEACEEALEVEANGDYDPETDVGALGVSILDAQAAGQNVDEILVNYSPVLNAELIEELDSALTNVKRAESAVEDAAAALEKAIDAAIVLDPDAVFVGIPAAAEAATTKLGDSTGATRLMTRAQNYLLRSQTAEANTAALNESGAAILETVGAVITANPISLQSKVIDFVAARPMDLLVIGGVLLVVSLLLILAPKWLAARWKNPMFRRFFWFALTVALLGAALYYSTGEMWELMRQGVFDTLYMTIPSTFFAYVLGLPLGVLLVITAPGNIRPNATLNSVLGTVVNFLRSIPFIILLVMLFDVTRMVMGSAIGTRAVIFPLFVSAFPYVARIVEGSLNEIDRGVIEAAESMGSTTWQIIRKVMLPESLPSLINGAALCMTTILAYTAMAGSAGGDGLGKIAITYGLNYREYDIMYVSSLLLVALVQIIQIGGNILMRAVDHRRKN